MSLYRNTDNKNMTQEVKKRGAKKVTSDWIKTRLIEKQYSQRNLADKLGVSESNVSRWLNGKRVIDNPTKIAIYTILR